MKKLIMLSFALVISTLISAQQAETKKTDTEMMGKNCIKLNLSSLVYKNIAVQYERCIGPKACLALQIRVMPTGKLLYLDALKESLGDNVDIGSEKVGSIAITPEFRYYVKDAMKGFYIAPYLRYRNVMIESPINYKDDALVMQKMTMDGNFNSFGGGVMIGSQFMLGKGFCLDWFIIGGHAMATWFDASGRTINANLSASEQATINTELTNKLKDNWLIKDYTVTTTSSGASLKGKFSFVGLRGFGLNLGYCF